MNSSKQTIQATQTPKKAKKYLAATLMALTMATVSSITLAGSHTDYARVTQATPIYETIAIRKPHRQCHLEERVVHHNNHRSATSTIVGALIGGAIGNELGHNKSNKRVGAVAGAILGGSIANDLNRGHRGGHHTKTQKVCNTSHTTHYEKQVTGYDVSYKYRGHIYHTVTDTHPGNRIKVAVDVRPVDY